VLAENWARPALKCLKLWTAGKNKEIGANLKFNLGKPDQKDSVTEVEGVLLSNGGLGIRAPGK
jgi:hypothetical protein